MGPTSSPTCGLTTAVALPFNFPFYGQVKNQVIVSSNGFLTFSGEHHASTTGLAGPYGGESFPMPNAMNPNDMIAVSSQAIGHYV